MNDKVHTLGRDNLFNIDEYDKKLSLKREIDLKFNKKDYELHLKSIQTITNSIWVKINN